MAGSVGLAGCERDGFRWQVLFDPIEFWRLTPFPRAAIVQAGESSFRDHVTVSVSQVGNVVLLYVPEAQTLRIPPGIWSATAKATWFDPRTGASRPASSAVAKPTGWEITTPGAGDWVLVVYPNK
ncbi:MAG: putative collagen-binding domain-containing protein [Verrucomicrobiota bacterium]